MTSGPLAFQEWDVVRFRVRNAGWSPLRDVSFTIGGPVRVAAPGALARLPDLAVGQETEVSFLVFPMEAGRYVPLQVRLAYQDASGRPQLRNDRAAVMVSGQSPSRSGASRAGTRADTILYLAASPTNMPQLRSDKEMREINERLQLGKHRDRFRLESAHAVRFKDIGQALADYDPKVVHFSGHGRRDGSILVEDEMGHSVPVAPAGLADLFGLHARTIGCVIVNACHSLPLAQAVNGRIDYVIAMRHAIGDGAAIAFSTGFYQGLAAGRPVAEAFERGRAFLRSQAVGTPEDGTLALFGPGGREQG